jgi:putative ABC transport system substrate-binding protein
MPSRTRRWLLLAAAAIILAAPTPLTTPPLLGAAPPTVALVTSSGIGPFAKATEAIRRVLERSSVQPELLTFDLEGSRENASRLLSRVRQANAKLVITVGSLATGVLLAEPWPTPVVFSMVLYPAQSGFLGSGREVTGASLDIPADTQFQMLRRLLPSARHLGVLYNAAETGKVVEAARSAAPRHGFRLEARTVEEPKQVAAALADLLHRVDAIWTVADSQVFTRETTAAFLLAAMRERIPVFGLSAAHVRKGALAALSCDYAGVGAQAGELALRVLRGERAAKLPPTFPRKVELSLNLLSARHLGLQIDEALQREAVTLVR